MRINTMVLILLATANSLLAQSAVDGSAQVQTACGGQGGCGDQCDCTDSGAQPVGFSQPCCCDCEQPHFFNGNRPSWRDCWSARFSCCHRIPRGDMSGHMPYESWQMYYYDRPYQARHSTELVARDVPLHDTLQAIYEMRVRDEDSSDKYDELEFVDEPWPTVSFNPFGDPPQRSTASQDQATKTNIDIVVPGTPTSINVPAAPEPSSQLPF